jgi:hypothetical protein
MHATPTPWACQAREETTVVDLSSFPDVRSVPQDLHLPRMVKGAPAPGKRVRQVAAAYHGTAVYHTLYLPTDWVRGRSYPVIVEYAGNGPYKNTFGDICSGRVEDCCLGYGISGGEGFIWVCLPYVSPDHQHNQLEWWGDTRATVAYCRTVIPQVCTAYGGDLDTVFIAGFSRGAIACNYIGLHDDEIAGLWLGFIAHSHYDGVRTWNYAGSERHAAEVRLGRLKGRAQFISHEGSVEQTEQFLKEADADGMFTFQAIPYRNHTDTWVLRDIPERRIVREWVREVLDLRPGCPSARRSAACDPGSTAPLPRDVKVAR